MSFGVLYFEVEFDSLTENLSADFCLVCENRTVAGHAEWP
jgi:hypothetical protein